MKSNEAPEESDHAGGHVLLWRTVWAGAGGSIREQKPQKPLRSPISPAERERKRWLPVTLTSERVMCCRVARAALAAAVGAATA